MRLGLRIDVDTFRGTRQGLPVLRRILADRGLQASIFLTVGPDNMGRHVWRMLRPSFAAKMFRSGAANIYGWDILLRGTLWPGPVIHRRLAAQLRGVADDGHEIGMHAWDHHRWQAYAHQMSMEVLRNQIRMAHDAITETIGTPPTCAAAPGWRCTEAMLAARDGLGYRYASDCRGKGIFQPPSGPPQICVNLPTWDETVGRDGITDESFNAYLRSCMRMDGFDVLTIHAESEGGAKATMFEQFLDAWLAEGGTIAPLGDLLGDVPCPPAGRMTEGTIPGRDGWVAVRRQECAA
jgi:undecaprenyl phosphate-alpha-L-ara4FN deformylase